MYVLQDALCTVPCLLIAEKQGGSVGRVVKILVSDV